MGEDNVMDGSLTFEEAVQTDYWAEAGLYEAYKTEFPDGLMARPEAWLAYDSPTRAAVLKLERDARAGVDSAVSLLNEMKSDIEAMKLEVDKDWPPSRRPEVAEDAKLPEKIITFAAMRNAMGGYQGRFEGEFTRPQDRTFERRINNRRFIGTKMFRSKANASNIAQRARNLNRYARVIPASGGWRVYLGPTRKV